MYYESASLIFLMALRITTGFFLLTGGSPFAPAMFPVEMLFTGSAPPPAETIPPRSSLSRFSVFSPNYTLLNMVAIVKSTGRSSDKISIPLTPSIISGI